MTAIAASAPAASPGRIMVTICAMSATIMQALDTTIANVALPYMQGSLSASLDQINWVLTSYIVASAIMTAPIGWVAERFGRKRLFIICAAGFTFASVLCGLAQNIEQMVAFRLLQGAFGAALVPLSQSVLLDAYSAEERGSAMAIWGIGVMLGPIMGPTLGAWLTENYSWHWVFFINLPIGIMTVAGLMIFMPETARSSARRFDWFGFAALALAIGSLQMMLDRGEQLGWFESNEVVAEGVIAAAAFYFFLAHSLTASSPFVRFELFKDRNFVAGCVFMMVIGVVLFGTMALVTPFMQHVIGYPILDCRAAAGRPWRGYARGDDHCRAAAETGRGPLSRVHRAHARDHHAAPDGRFHRPDLVAIDHHRKLDAGLRSRAGFRAVEHGGVCNPASPSAHRGDRRPDAPAQHRKLDRDLHRHRPADQHGDPHARQSRRVDNAIQ